MTALPEVDLVLASTSRYRRELLARLTPDFRCVAPNVDESPLPDESPTALVTRLAGLKACDVAVRAPGGLVIGSDQVADLNGTILGKPGSIESACAQLAACSGREVVFHTAISIVDARAATMPASVATDETRVHFRELDAQAISRYVERERPLDCAGSFKCEGLGIALFERIETNDPTALIGLPLIALCKLLRKLGIAIP